MALALAPMTFARGIVLVPGTSVVAVDGTPAAAPIPDNCYRIRVTNPDGANDGLVGVGTAPAALTAGINSTRIAAGTFEDFDLGTIGDRGPMDQATLNGSGFIYDAIGGAITLEVTYFNKIGSP